MKVVYSLYDPRYLYDKDKAILYTECDTLKEAKEDQETMFPDSVIVKETLQLSKDGKSSVIVKDEIVGYPQN